MKNGERNTDRNYTQLITAGTAAQMEKLKQNEHKRGFDNISFEYAYHRLIEEVGELSEAFRAKVVNIQGIKNIRSEAEDVANFAHMIILKCDKLIKEMSE